jgi:hypothetical protein
LEVLEVTKKQLASKLSDLRAGPKPASKGPLLVLIRQEYYFVVFPFQFVLIMVSQLTILREIQKSVTV